MLLRGEGGPKNVEEGLMWLERAGEQGEYTAFRLLVDCYENAYCGVPMNAGRAGLWRGRLGEYERLHPSCIIFLMDDCALRRGAPTRQFLNCGGLVIASAAEAVTTAAAV